MDRFVIKMVDFDSIPRSETKDCKNSILLLFHPTLNTVKESVYSLRQNKRQLPAYLSFQSYCPFKAAKNMITTNVI